MSPLRAALRRQPLSRYRRPPGRRLTAGNPVPGGHATGRVLRAVAALGLVVGAALAVATPAQAASGVWVTVNPSTVGAGLQVGITGSCGENVNTASVSSGAFTSPVTLTPVNGVLSATAVVPSTTKAQGYPVTLNCASGNAATSTLWVVNNTTPSKGPATGGGGSSHDTGSTLLAGGLAALLGAAALGIVARRRRRVPVRL